MVLALACWSVFGRLPLSVTGMGIVLDNSDSVHAYVSDLVGKRIKKGMAVEVVPTTVKREEVGYIRGVVESVSEFPQTPQTMLKTIGNEALIKTLSNGVAPFSVLVRLKKKASGVLEWSTRAGDNSVSFDRGALCNIAVVTETRSPISFLIPVSKH